MGSLTAPAQTPCGAPLHRPSLVPEPSTEDCTGAGRPGNPAKGWAAGGGGENAANVLWRGLRKPAKEPVKSGFRLPNCPHKFSQLPVTGPVHTFSKRKTLTAHLCFPAPLATTRNLKRKNDPRSALP